MSFWVLMQILVNVVLLAACGVLWVKLNRPAKDDPRLSKGLQLLQSKIAVLEDLSDRTEVQVNQLTSLMESKIKEIQQQIILADRQIDKIMQAQEKSMEVAKIFQDKIPHEEILERQSTIKYVQAAKMANSGHSVDDICHAVDLSRGEIEFIAKVNRDHLQFDEATLPDWAKDGLTQIPTNQSKSVDYSKAFEAPAIDQRNLKKLGEEFKKAVSNQGFLEMTPSAVGPKSTPVKQQTIAAPVSQDLVHSVLDKVTLSNGKTAVAKPAQFRKIEI